MLNNPSLTRIKPQGIKKKLAPWINDLILTSGTELNAHPHFRQLMTRTFVKFASFVDENRDEKVVISLGVNVILLVPLGKRP